MSHPDLRLWIGKHVLAVRNATYFPGFILEVSNASKCVMVEFKNFHGLVTMYEDVFNRGDLSIINDVCPSYSDIKVGLRVAIKSWSYDSGNQILYIPGFVVAILNDCGRFLVRNCYDIERLVGIDELRIIIPFWWEYAYYHFQGHASKQNYVQQSPAFPQMQPQHEMRSGSQPQPHLQQQPQPQLLHQLQAQHQSLLSQYPHYFQQPYYPWQQLLPRLPPPYPGEAYKSVNPNVNYAPILEKENLNIKNEYREIQPKLNDYNCGPKEMLPKLSNMDYKYSEFIKAMYNQVSDKKMKDEVNINHSNSVLDSRNQSVKAKIAQVPVVNNLPEVPTVVKAPVAPVLPKLPEVPAVTKTPVAPVLPKLPEFSTIMKTPAVPILPKLPEVSAATKRPVVPILPKLPELPNVAKLPGLSAAVKVSEVPDTTYLPTTILLGPYNRAPQEDVKPQPKKRKYERKKKPNEDPNALRRPMNAFMYYSQEHRNFLLCQNPQGLDNRHISKVLAENWYKLSAAEKLKYHRLAAKAKEENYKADPERLCYRRKNSKNKVQCEISQFDAKVSSSDDEPRLVIDESRLNEESEDNSSPLFVPKSSNSSQLKTLLVNNKPKLPAKGRPKINNKENILEANNGKLPTIPEVDDNVTESVLDMIKALKSEIKTAEYCNVSNISFNGGSMEQTIENKSPVKEKTLIGEKFFPPDFSIEAVQKSETPISTLTEAVIKEILITDAYFNNTGHCPKAQKKRLVVLNLFKENGYYPPDHCIEEVMQKHADLFDKKNRLKTKIREVRQKLLSKVKNGTVPISPLLKDMIGSMIPDGDSPLTTPGSD